MLLRKFCRSQSEGLGNAPLGSLIALGPKGREVPLAERGGVSWAERLAWVTVKYVRVTARDLRTVKSKVLGEAG